MVMKPIGIAILSIFSLVVGTLAFLAGIILVAFSTIIVITPRTAEEIARNLGQLPGMPFGIHGMIAPAELLLVFTGVFIITIGIIMAVIGWGLWIGANWARWIAIIYFGLGALSSLSNVLQGQFGTIISLVINGLIVYYLFLPHVKRFFKASV